MSALKYLAEQLDYKVDHYRPTYHPPDPTRPSELYAPALIKQAGSDPLLKVSSKRISRSRGASHQQKREACKASFSEGILDMSRVGKFGDWAAEAYRSRASKSHMEHRYIIFTSRRTRIRRRSENCTHCRYGRAQELTKQTKVVAGFLEEI